MGVVSWAFTHGLAYTTRVPDAFPIGYVEALRRYVLDSPYLAANNLNYRFAGTRGFSVVFRRDGLARVREQFPIFAPYLDRTVDEACNAFFLNPLVVCAPANPHDAPAGVAMHVDRSLRSFTAPHEPPNPRRVSVLYVQVPREMRGGVLRFYHGYMPVGRVCPRENMLVNFQGGLRHEVTATQLPAGTARLSLVCEHYVLDAALLARVPEFTVRSTRDFDGFLEAELAEPGDADDAAIDDGAAENGPFSSSRSDDPGPTPGPTARS